jgi:hypothetical protein
MAVLLRIIVLFIRLLAAIAVVILLFAFVFSLLGANPTSTFVAWTYGRAGELMRPFGGIFGAIHFVGRGTFRWSLLMAALIYGAIASIFTMAI